MYIQQEEREILARNITIHIDPCISYTRDEIKLLLKLLSTFECCHPTKTTLDEMKEACCKILNIH